jgi:signal transduction histidine kinase
VRRLFLNYYLFLVFVLVMVWFAAVPLVEYFASAPFREDYDRYYRELMRGTFELVTEDLASIPPAEWARRIDELQPDFGYPLELVTIDEAGVSAAQREQLRAGTLVVGTGYDQFWRRIDETDRVLVMGPFPAPQVGRSVDFLTWALVLGFLGVATTLWALPFARELRDFRRTAAAFGEGRFESRATTRRHSPLAPLATSFNRMADRIEQLITSHRELTNAVAHELRTPISRLRFGLEMVESAGDEATRERSARELRRDLDDLEALVEELLVYARFDRTAPDLELEPHAFRPWIEELHATLVAETTAQVELDCAIENGRPVRFDPRHLARALENLVHNADRHGGDHVRIVARTDGDDVVVAVDDDGHGIPVDERERVFEAFARLDSSRSRDSGGFGLGLAIVRRVAEAHGGRVELTDSDLGGCRFTVRWLGTA